MFDLIVRGKDKFKQILTYNPHDSSLVWEETGIRVNLVSVGMQYNDNFKEVIPYFPLSPTNPAGKNKAVKKLKIQMGLKCNYNCEYCNQASQPDTVNGNPKEVANFLSHLDTWIEGEPDKVELWGGEPLLYWKSLKPLAIGIRERFPNTNIMMITNGSLLNDEKIKFIEDMDISVGISHDGPGQYIRGPDPLLTDSLQYIKKLYAKRFPVGKISFNCVLTKNNLCISEIRQHIAKYLDIPEFDVNLSTEELFTPYEESVIHLGPVNEVEHSDVVHKVFWESVIKGSLPTVHGKLQGFFSTIASGTSSEGLGQKCSMDNPNNLSVDLFGNVLTCQNTSADDARHKIGHVDNFSNIKLTSSTHWSQRKECPKCPVLQLCKGSCMFTHDDLWTAGCNSSFTYNVALLASAIYHLTGYVLVEIRGDNIRDRCVSSINVLDIVEIESGDIWKRFSNKQSIIPIKKV